MVGAEEIGDLAVGRLGELEVELELVKQGWHPVRLDTAQMAANADLPALSGRHRVSIQVKATNAIKKHSHREWLSFGYSTNYVRHKRSIFNSKPSPLEADLVVAVSYRQGGTRFVVLPVAAAEALCRLQVDYWSSVPTGTETGKRSDSFPIYLCFTAIPRAHSEHHSRIQKNVLAFENRWGLLREPIERLHDSGSWPLLP